MTALRAVPDRPKRAIRYLRQSTEKEETISDAIQLAACDDHIARCGYAAVGEPIWDPGITGRVWHKRKGVQEAMQWVERGDADVIVVWKWNRLSRLRKHWVLAEVAIEKLGGAIESATEPADLTTSHGRFSRNIMIDLAELQSDLIGDSWRDTHATRRRRGLPAAGGRRYGYTRHREPGEPERYVINPEEAEVLKWAYSSYIGGMGFNAMAWELNRRGVPGLRGGAWAESSVSALLDAGFGAGLLPRFGERGSDGRSIRPSFPDRTWESGAQDPIIDADVWEKYKRARLDRRKEPSRNINPAHDMAGLIVCGDCLWPMHRRSGSPVPQYVCSQWKTKGTVRFVASTQNRVRRAVMEWLREKAADIEGAAERADAVREDKLRARTDVELAAREVLAIDQQLDKATRQNVAGVIPDGTYIRVRDQLLAERAAKAERLAIAERAAEVPDFSPVHLAGELLEEWDTLPVARRRDMLKRLIKQVKVVPSGRKGVGNTIIIDPT